MAKSYLITLTQSDLESIVFNAVDRALKLNKLAIKEGGKHPEKPSSEIEKNEKKEVHNDQ